MRSSFTKTRLRGKLVTRNGAIALLKKLVVSKMWLLKALILAVLLAFASTSLPLRPKCKDCNIWMKDEINKKICSSECVE
ncbi:unnamed protein product [Cylicocyclus nassatus]|uniref:Uncharacterized protein n=1 Tax=Cylicocyclus nassatus TaxID=53992 RepID=A0AA36GQP8_CYLNA|nr:unnamed protein product [Cylicocyclus nassatus]